MKSINLTLNRVVQVVALTSMAIVSVPTYAAGLLSPVNSGSQALLIKEHHVEVEIDGGYAITTIEQVFYNPNDVQLEANYSFPVPHKAAVGEFTYWINGKPITGEVVEKNEARDIYRQESNAGNAVALTEKNDYLTFENKVAHVQPKTDIRIRLKYIQAAHVDLGVGRYVYPLEEGGVDTESIAFWSTNSAVKEAFSFNLKLRSPYAIQDIRLPQHPNASVIEISPNEWAASIGNQPSLNDLEGEPATSATPVQNLDKDIVVYWRHQASLPGSVDMVTYRDPDSKRGTFMITVTPGDDLPRITDGRDWIFVLDISGSMQGKFTSLIDGVLNGLKKLNPNDRVKIVLFNTSGTDLTNGYVNVTPENIAQISQALGSITPNGGTDLYKGMQRGFKGLDTDRASAVLLVTDGVANVGVTEKKQFLKLLEAADVRLHTFVMGNSANKPLLESMSDVSSGVSMNISNSDDIAGRVIQAGGKMSHYAYRDIELALSGKGVTIEDVTSSGIGSLYHGQQLIVFGHYRGDGPGELIIKGKVAGEGRKYTSALQFPASDTANPEIERLWAFATIENIQKSMDYLGDGSEGKGAIIDIAKEYSLVTDYTSMVVLQEEQFQQYGIDRNNVKRIAVEERAKNQRSQSQVVSTRQDTQQPAFASSRPEVGGGVGGGALGPWSLILLLPLLLARKCKAKQ